MANLLYDHLIYSIGSFSSLYLLIGSYQDKGQSRFYMMAKVGGKHRGMADLEQALCPFAEIEHNWRKGERDQG
jgi:hypothetical protein